MIIWWPSASGGTCPVSTDPGEENVLITAPPYLINGATKQGNYTPTDPSVVKAGVLFGSLLSLIGTYGNLIAAVGGSVELPDMSDALLSWLQPMVFTNITKSVVASQLVETPASVSFSGVWQPFSAAQLMIKPMGQRSWNWYMCHALTNLALETDDVVNYEGVQYRVMAQNPYPKYGFYEYHLVADYTGSGPT